MKKVTGWTHCLILICALTTLTHQYALEGTWTLTNHKDIKLDPSIDVQFQFTQQIGDNSTIQKRMIVRACYELSYDYQVEQNNIYSDFQNVISIPRKCLPGQITTIKAKIDTIFYFSINGTTLTLFDPTGFAPFVFIRVDAKSGPAINGQWKTLTIDRNSINQKILINGSHAILCEGKGVAFYRISNRTQIIFNIIKSKGCSDESRSILIALDNAAYYRIRNETFLYLYDYTLNNVFYAFYDQFVSYKENLQERNQNVVGNNKNKIDNNIAITQHNNRQQPSKTVPPQQPSKTVPPQQPSKTVPPQQPSKTVPPQQPSKTVPPQQPSKTVPPQQPSKTVPPQQPSKTVPPQQPSKTVPPQQPSKTVPPQQPSKTVPPQQPSKTVPPQQPSKTVPPQQPSKTVPPQQPSKTVPPQQPSKTVPPQQPSKTVPPQQPSKTVPPQQPSKTVPPQQPSKTVPPQQPSKTVPPQQPSKTVPPQQPSKTVPPQQPSKTVPPQQPSKTVPPQQPSKTVPPQQPSKTVPPQQPSKTVPPQQYKKQNQSSQSSHNSVKQVISSESDLKPFSSVNSLDGKWFIYSLPSKLPSFYSNYYLIINSSAKRFVLYGGCNVHIYNYNLVKNKISFGKPTSTAKVCNPNNDSDIAIPLFSNSVYVEATSNRLKFYDQSFKQNMVLANTPQ